MKQSPMSGSRDPKVAQRILAAVEEREDESIELLQALVRIDSTSGKEGDIQAFIAGFLESNGLDVEALAVDLDDLAGKPGYVEVEVPSFAERPNLIGRWRGAGGGRSLILNGHVDTIPAGSESGWLHAPLSGNLDNGSVFGRGASDMKSGLAAMTMAVKALKDIGLKLRGDVSLQYVVDEEVTGFGTLAAVHRGYTADAAICCETSDLQVQPACIGRLWFKIEVTGKPASIAERWKSVSAIEKAVKLVHAINDLEAMRIADCSHPLYTDARAAVPCAVCMFESGIHPSAIPVHACLQGSLGVLPNEAVETVKSTFRAQLDRIANADPWLRANPPIVSFKDIGADGAEIDPGHPVVSTLQRAFKAATGREAVVSGRTGGADTRYLIKHGGVPSVIFGPGPTSQMHSVNESVPIANLSVATKTLALAVYEWCA